MPLARFPLWAIARTSPPVFFSYSASHFQRARGLVLPSGGIGLVDQCGGELALREHADQLHRYADDFVTASKTIPDIEPEPVSKRSCIHRDIGVQVRVAPKRPARKAALRVGRVRLAGVGFGEHRLSIFGRRDLSDHGCHCGQGACEQDTEKNTLHDFPLWPEPTSSTLNAAMAVGSPAVATILVASTAIGRQASPRGRLRKLLSPPRRNPRIASFQPTPPGCGPGASASRRGAATRPWGSITRAGSR